MQLLTTQHPASSWAAAPGQLSHEHYTLSIMPCDMEFPFGLMGSAVPAVSPSNFLCPPAHLLVGWGEEQKRPWLNVSTAQQQQKYQCVNFIRILNSKHSTVPSTRKKVNSIPAKAWQLHIATTYLSSSGVVWASIFHKGFAHGAHRHSSLRLRNFKLNNLL